MALLSVVLYLTLAALVVMVIAIVVADSQPRPRKMPGMSLAVGAARDMPI
ncbi:MAG: hypothetical protein ACYDGR_00395 [Candidatus Dormibacteria bacterium]